MNTLSSRFADAVHQWPERIALDEPEGGRVRYGELATLAKRTHTHLNALDVRKGDRVGVFMRKSIDSVAAILGILNAGAAYVPVDAGAPMWRAAYILADCTVKAVFVHAGLADELTSEFEKLGVKPTLIAVQPGAGGTGLLAAVSSPESGHAYEPVPVVPDDLAYILYTSGSTGKPKGVMLSHGNATSFVDWCIETFAPTEHDRFSSHAPLHFDLSILDLYVPLSVGASVLLIGSDLGKDPAALAALIASRQLTVWYSTPSILSMLAQYGKMERHEYPALRAVLFAGEVFPVKHLRAVQSHWRLPRYYNLYGPTETNVCTFYEVVGLVPPERTEPYPIGIACSHLRTRVVDENGAEVPRGSEGELVVNGPAVMCGYWNLPDHTARAFLVDDFGAQWYRTGDIVVEAADGNYSFMGRRDRMVKRRGYRIELGEIESGLYRHPSVKEAAVVALRSNEGVVTIRAFLSCHVGPVPSVIELKRFCAETLPIYMVPDAFVVRDAIPKTSTDKIDYQRLVESP